MYLSLPEVLEVIEKEFGKEKAVTVGLAIDGCLYREPAAVIARYTGLSIKGIRTMKKDIRTDNKLDYFSV